MDDRTTIWIDRETKNSLKIIAEKNGRNIMGQLRLMVRQAMEDLDLEQSGEEQPVETK